MLIIMAQEMSIDVWHAMDGDLARILITILCRDQDKNSLMNIMDQYSSQLSTYDILSVDQLKEFLEHYPHIFSLRSQDVSTSNGTSFGPRNCQVMVTTELKICEVHSKEVGSCDGQCGRLHMCKFFLLSDKCNYKYNCRFGHEFQNHHNATVLQHYLMDHLSIEEVRMLFRRLDARVPLTRPMICHYYNTQNGCNKDDSCSALHICKYFFTGCKFEDKCRRNHDVSVNKIHEILEQYAVEFEDLPEMMWDASQNTPQSYQPSSARLATLSRSWKGIKKVAPINPSMKWIKPLHDQLSVKGKDIKNIVDSISSHMELLKSFPVKDNIHSERLGGPSYHREKTNGNNPLGMGKKEARVLSEGEISESDDYISDLSKQAEIKRDFYTDKYGKNQASRPDERISAHQDTMSKYKGSMFANQGSSYHARHLKSPSDNSCAKTTLHAPAGEQKLPNKRQKKHRKRKSCSISSFQENSCFKKRKIHVNPTQGGNPMIGQYENANDPEEMNTERAATEHFDMDINNYKINNKHNFKIFKNKAEPSHFHHTNRALQHQWNFHRRQNRNSEENVYRNLGNQNGISPSKNFATFQTGNTFLDNGHGFESQYLDTLELKSHHSVERNIEMEDFTHGFIEKQTRVGGSMDEEQCRKEKRRRSKVISQERESLRNKERGGYTDGNVDLMRHSDRRIEGGILNSRNVDRMREHGRSKDTQIDQHRNSWQTRSVGIRHDINGDTEREPNRDRVKEEYGDMEGEPNRDRVKEEYEDEDIWRDHFRYLYTDRMQDRSMDRGNRQDRSMDRGSRQDRSMDRGSRQDRSMDRGSRQDRSMDRGSRQDRSMDRGSRQDRSMDRGSRQDRSMDRGSRQDRSMDRGNWRDTSVGSRKWQDTSVDSRNWQDRSVDSRNWQDRSMDRGNWQDRSMDRGSRQDRSMDSWSKQEEHMMKGSRYDRSIKRWTEQIRDEDSLEKIGFQDINNKDVRKRKKRGQYDGNIMQQKNSETNRNEHWDENSFNQNKDYMSEENYTSVHPRKFSPQREDEFNIQKLHHEQEADLQYRCMKDKSLQSSELVNESQDKHNGNKFSSIEEWRKVYGNVKQPGVHGPMHRADRHSRRESLNIYTPDRDVRETIDNSSQLNLTIQQSNFANHFGDEGIQLLDNCFAENHLEDSDQKGQIEFNLMHSSQIKNKENGNPLRKDRKFDLRNHLNKKLKIHSKFRLNNKIKKNQPKVNITYSLRSKHSWMLKKERQLLLARDKNLFNNSV